MTTNRHTDNPGYKPKHIFEWVRNILGVWGYLTRLSQSKDSANAEWTRKQFDAYWDRFRVLMDNPPKIPSAYITKKLEGLLNGRNIQRVTTKPTRKNGSTVHTRSSKHRSK